MDPIKVLGTFWCGRARGYKTIHDGHSMKIGYGKAQTNGESLVAIFDPGRPYIYMTEDLEDGARYLTSLL